MQQKQFGLTLFTQKTLNYNSRPQGLFPMWTKISFHPITFSTSSSFLFSMLPQGFIPVLFGSQILLITSGSRFYNSWNERTSDSNFLKHSESQNLQFQVLKKFRVRKTPSSRFLKILKELAIFMKEPAQNWWSRVVSLTWFFNWTIIPQQCPYTSFFFSCCSSTIGTTILMQALLHTIRCHMHEP